MSDDVSPQHWRRSPLSLQGEGLSCGEDPLLNPLPKGRGDSGDVPQSPFFHERKLTIGGVNRNATLKTQNYAKSLRNNLTEAEKHLWYHLRAKRFSEYKFRSQHAMMQYIVDFICLKEKLIIELDGGQHSMQNAYDQNRTKQLTAQGFRVLRFWNNEVMKNTDAVLQIIAQALSPDPLLEGRRER